MKMLSTLLLISCLHVSAISYSQQITLSLKNVPLEKVFQAIKKQSTYLFIYNNRVLAKAKPVTIHVKNVLLNEVLAICFNQQPLDWELDGNTIIIKEKQASLSQEVISIKSISGKVTDESNNPIEAASVVCYRTGKMKLTDNKGEYTLNGISENDILIFSSIGYEQQKIPVPDSGVLNAKMRVAVKGLDEMMVVAYGKTSRRLNTGSVSKITAEEIDIQPVSNLLAALEGRVPGLLITQSSGVPGSAFKVQIRGRSALDPSLSGNDPLIVIDGVPFESGNSSLSQLLSAANTPGSASEGGLSPLNLLNPGNIASIEVLRDADATAIYGSRGSNGVILITTRKPETGKSLFTLSTYTGFGRPARKMDLLNTRQYIAMRREAFHNDDEEPTGSSAPDILLWDTTRYTDFNKLLIGKKAVLNDLQASLNGGNSHTGFLAGISLHRETTVYSQNMEDKRISGSISINHLSGNERFSLSCVNLYTYDKSKLPQLDLTQFQSLPPNLKLYDDNGELSWEEAGINYNFVNGIANPLSYFRQNFKAVNENLFSSLNIDYKIAQGISFTVRMGYNKITTSQLSATPSSSINPFLLTYVRAHANFADAYISTLLAEPVINYSRIAGKSSLQIMAGTAMQKKVSATKMIAANNYASDLFLNSPNAAGSIQSSANYSKYYYMACYARFNYNWKQKYIVNLSGRKDGSSRFSPKNRTATFTAIGTAWIFSNENFTKGLSSFLNFGKLRGSYGTTGNDQIGDYRFLDLWNNTYYTYQGIPGLSPATLYNTDFEWEKNRKLEIALELELLNSRIYFSAAWYRHRSSNQLVNYSLPVQTGFSAIVRNLPALVQNSGLEFAISSQNILTKQFRWESSFNITLPKNKLLSFPALEKSPYANQYAEGKSLDVIKRYRFTGVNSVLGVYSFEDSNKDGIISYPGDYQIVGKTDPSYYGGIRNVFSFKQVTLDIFLQFTKQTGKNYLAVVYSSPPGFIYNQPVEVLDRWQKAGDIAAYQKYTQSYRGPASLASGTMLNISNGIYSDASFIRCKNLALAWNISGSRLQRIKISGIKIFSEAQNLVTITSYKGTDPENQNFNQLPPLRTIVVGISVNL